jgi:alpha-tubulin suppressor-like RCC1 family protein
VGDGTTVDRDQPTPVKNVQDVVAVTADLYYSCALELDGEVWCWGEGGFLGDGTVDDSPLPLRVRISRVIQVTSRTHTCALTADGRVFCWGCPYPNGGCGSSEPVLVPREVGGLPPIAKVSGGSRYTCALSFEGEVFCWGEDIDCATGVMWDLPTPRKLEFPPLE